MGDVYAFLSQGGWLMIPILLCSVVGLAFFLERLWSLRRSRILPQTFLSGLFEALEDGNFERANGLCDAHESPLGPMVQAAIDRAGEDRATVKEIVSEEGQREVFYMERFVNALGAIATISPLLGLLGTVVGMIDVFQDVVTQSSAAGQVQAAALASGIWQALITTASGLTVAIPVYVGYRYILSRVDKYAVEIQEHALRAVDYIAGTPPRATEAEDVDVVEGPGEADAEEEATAEGEFSKEGVA